VNKDEYITAAKTCTVSVCCYILCWE